jgi:argininosuccinate lyase
MSTPQRSQPVWASGKPTGSADLTHMHVAYCAGRDVQGRPAADAALAVHDLATNAAHALMLMEEGIVSPEEGRALLGALNQLRQHHANGTDLLRPAAEDIHMSIEEAVTEICGEGAGGRLHTGRSRNDQVATDMRLWLREEVAMLGSAIANLADALITHAREHAHTPCPGWTHLQPAMVTTWGHWVSGYVSRLVRDLRHLAGLLGELDECPLGSAASFATSWPVNRRRTAYLLGFKRPTANTIDSAWGRGELETRFAFVAAQHLSHLAGIGQDLMLLSSPPRRWVKLSVEFTTGSSIMPQKRNPDFAEVTRARAAVVRGHVEGLLGILTPAASGYNRDVQWTKYSVMDAAEEVRDAPAVFREVFRTLNVDAKAMRDACREGFLEATDMADHLARTRNLPFRACYRVLGAAVTACEATGHLTRDALNNALEKVAPGTTPLSGDEMATFSDPLELVKQRIQPGGPHPDRLNESLDALQSQVDVAGDYLLARQREWTVAIEMLWEMVGEKGKGEG